MRSVGVVVEVGFNMWGEEGDRPTGIRVLWQDSFELEYVFDDELIKLSDVK